jgi:hypothetical protein
MPETTETGNNLPTVEEFPEVLVLGVYDPDGTVILLRPDRPVPPGQRVG